MAQEASLVPLYTTSPLHEGLAPFRMQFQTFLLKSDKHTAQKMRIFKKQWSPSKGGEIGFCKCKKFILEYTCIIAREGGKKNPDE